VGNEIASRVDNCDVHWLTDGLGLLFGGGDNSSGICECDHDDSSIGFSERKQ
jgi:hypothetical protein